ncbi:30S ribosomal protein S8 [Candidatus Uhrbacteria bacterium RIFCSPHIGHO2_01_FULL_63_20]|uniref:Small ribosomal subunit protein uS8 n=1 Tax=Candidatus Uhrbacteria bacterium RIFCSPHIGHO2_01_FULL_63_20 TaxID=1802385 RepID=A0A1F7TMI5_9BACT|nr:MAG: 30S ribosomal protein S8 [Candidatus Uhrbacteria bacterium RIFCSPHIGHO2_01_FULL_63_20]
MITDPISDMLTRLRNAISVRREFVELPSSNVKYAIAKILEREGYLASVEKTGEGIHTMLKLGLNYANGPRIQSLRRVSKPGRRVYAKADELKPVMSGMGVSIVSTPNGLMTNREARARRLGGEVICEIS